MVSIIVQLKMLVYYVAHRVILFEGKYVLQRKRFFFMTPLQRINYFTFNRHQGYITVTKNWLWSLIFIQHWRHLNSWTEPYY